jgi:hypothetical protein
MITIVRDHTLKPNIYINVRCTIVMVCGSYPILSLLFSTKTKRDENAAQL